MDHRWSINKFPSTLFHTVYIPGSKSDSWTTPAKPYSVPLKDDYPEDELKKLMEE